MYRVMTSFLRRSTGTRRWLTKQNHATNRRAIMQKKQEELLSMIEAHQDAREASEEISTSNTKNKHAKNEHEESKRLELERSQLFDEASFITKSLYRSCLRCINLLREANQHDIADFEAREEKEKLDRLHISMGASFSFEPPVDRDNELSSRALYYQAFAKESFNQEVDCLLCDPWKEDNIQRFLYLVRQGEERRKWILDQYQFEDPFPNKWDDKAVDKWEESASKLIRETYGLNGWLFKEDFTKGDSNSDEDDGIDWNLEDDIEEDNTR